MTTINDNNKVDLSTLGTSIQQQTKKTQLGQEDFFALLSAQINNQDPLEPQSNTDFVAQIAQFSTLEGVTNLNDSFSSFAQSMQSSQALQATTLVGHSVLIDSNIGLHSNTQPLSGIVDLPNSVNELKVTIHNGQGEVIREIALGPQASGLINFQWDGLDKNGNGVEPGLYGVSAIGSLNNEDSQYLAYVKANVNSVTLGNNNQELVLNLDGLGGVPMSQVKQIQ